MYFGEHDLITSRMLRYVSPDAINRVGSELILGKLRTESDFPHSEYHRRQVGNYAFLIGKEVGLSDLDLLTLQVAAKAHDLGYKLGELGVDHQYASLLAARINVNEEADINFGSLAKL